MTIPSSEALRQPILAYHLDVEVVDRAALRDALTGRFPLDEGDLADTLPSGGSRWASRVDDAVSALVDDGLLERTGRGQTSLTVRGRRVAGGRGFDPGRLDRSVVAPPLLEAMAREPDTPLHTIIDLNLVHPGGLEAAREALHLVVEEATGVEVAEVIDLVKCRYTPQYAYVRLTPEQIRTLVRLDSTARVRSIHRIWPDFDVDPLLTDSIATIKGDAARIAFSAAGRGITWAVADTGIDGTHPHFLTHDTVNLQSPLRHMDFAGDQTHDLDRPEDPNGHGTHVAGIIAGEYDPATPPEDAPADGLWTATARRTEANDTVYDRQQLDRRVSGVAPYAKLVSLRVLDANGEGRVSNLLAACGYIHELNEHGRRIRIHGVNMSVGYGFDPEWFACGQSPLCVEVDRLVRSGVSVVVAAGNTGYLQRGARESNQNAGLGLTINDPGNADLAITVGATHRSEPHIYGVSYFSSKGPTGDGRSKPDLVAPGERVLSCAGGSGRATIEAQAGGDVHYREWSGTSMAAPHVSGAIAAFLSIRTEFIGRPERVKEIFLSSATDLGRERYFQGHGLVDLMRAIQSV